tara:strand:- start:112 stop:324 length:213 start_codon:yes stop_codon:yes gene_type:complete
MSLRDDNKVNYNYYEYLNELDWVSHNTSQRAPLKQNDRLINLTKVVEDLQNRIEILENIQQKEWEQKMDS